MYSIYMLRVEDWVNVVDDW